jgi:hypothetical protein
MKSIKGIAASCFHYDGALLHGERSHLVRAKSIEDGFDLLQEQCVGVPRSTIETLDPRVGGGVGGIVEIQLRQGALGLRIDIVEKYTFLPTAPGTLGLDATSESGR